MHRGYSWLPRMGALATAALLAACADGPTTPGATVKALPNTVVLSRLASGSGNFTIDPTERLTVIIGEHKLTIPKGAVCDPASSGYGKELWDAPCAPATQPIEVHVDWSDADGASALQFSPDLRFVPSASTKPNDWVVLELRNAAPLDPSRAYQILWKDTATDTWVDEANSDSTLRAWSNRADNKVARRLKHFSGYQIGSSLAERDGVSVDAGLTVWAY